MPIHTRITEPSKLEGKTIERAKLYANRGELLLVFTDGTFLHAEIEDHYDTYEFKLDAEIGFERLKWMGLASQLDIAMKAIEERELAEKKAAQELAEYEQRRKDFEGESTP